jgi:hypothetical protein
MADWRMHPEDGALLRYCDGELRAKDTAQIARHLEACWDCRTRLDDLKQTIAEYVRYRRDILEPSLPPPPQPWRNLPLEYPGPSPRRAVWLVACTLTAGAAVLIYQAQSSRPVPPRAAVSAPPSAPAPAPRVATAPAPRPAPAPAGPEDELRVMAALDRIGADLGDPIEVVRTPSRIVVTCIGLEAGRMRQVRAALAGLPRVTVELSPKPNGSVTASPLEVVGAPHASAPAAVARQFDSPAAYERFVDGLLKSGETMMARAHALRRLATRFPVDVEAPMPPDSKALLAAIRERHQTALAREVASLQISVRPFLPPPPSPALPANRPAEGWQARAMRLFSETSQVDRLLAAVFAGSQGAAAAESDPAALSAALAKLEEDVAP